MIKYPEVLVHFTDLSFKIISFTFENIVYSVVKQSLLHKDEEKIIVSVTCQDSLKIELTFDRKTLKWSYC